MNKLISKVIEIKATSDKVWHVFINPKVTIQMGGEYVSDWRVGSSLRWKGKDGKIYTDGKIQQIIPERILTYELLDVDDTGKRLSVISYKFDGSNGSTLLSATEELNYEVTETQFEEISEGWDFALAAVKNIAEGLK